MVVASVLRGRSVPGQGLFLLSRPGGTGRADPVCAGCGRSGIASTFLRVFFINGDGPSGWDG